MTKRLVFTFHKAGSMAIHQHLVWLSHATGLAYHSPNNRNARRPLLHAIEDIRVNDDPDYWARNLAPLDGLIGPLRRPIALPLEIGGRGVLCLRDPRDALTSMFYSFTYSHAGVSEAVREARAQAGIDRFVLERADDMKGRLRSYRALAGSRPDWAVLRYEDMVLDFPAWLERLVAGLDLAPESLRLRGYAARIAAENAALLAARREREEPLSHIRSIRPGDHASKLMPETISALTSLFADDLDAFGYLA